MMDFPEPIRSAQNPQVQRMRKWISQPTKMRKEGIFLCDGFHLVEEALRANLVARFLAVDATLDHPEWDALRESAAGRSIPIVPVASRIFRSLSPVESPQGILGVFERTPSSRLPRSGTIIVADGIQDPGNLGSICRSARAAGATGLAILPGTVDAFHPRALRASMGAMFAWPITRVNEVSELEHGSRISIALTNQASETITDLDPNLDYALFLGSEGTGLRPETDRSVDRHVTIPMSRDVESLGVAAAAAVALFWLRLRSDGASKL